MRFLIDECLSIALVEVANQMGFAAWHVVHRGWQGRPDHSLFEAAAGENLIFVTNNRSDFFKLAKTASLHAGLIVIVPNVRRARQQTLFRIALSAAKSRPSMVNTVIEIDEDEISKAYELPAV